MVLVLWSIQCVIFVSEKDAYEYLLPSISILVLFYGLAYLISYPLHKFQNGYKVALWAKLIGPLCCILMNNFKYGSYDNNFYGLLMGIQYDTIFLAQGILDQQHIEPCLKYRNELAKTVLTPLSIGMFYVMNAFTSPMNHSDTGFLFYYPLYFKFEFQSLFVLGTWQWTYAIVWIMKEISNEKFNDFLYDLIVGSSMWAYISHYVFIVLSANYFVRVFSLTYHQAVVANFLWT